MLSEKIINFCKKIEFFSYCALIFFLPISIALSETFASFTLFFFFVKRWTIFITSSRQMLREKSLWVWELLLGFCRIVKPEKSILSRPLGIFILICAISVFFSRYPALSVKGFFFKVLQWTYLYFVFIEFIKEKKHFTVFMTVFLISASVVFLNGLFQYFFGKDFIFNEIYADRLYSCFRQANDFGAYLVLTCPMILSVIFCRNLLKTARDHREMLFKILLLIVFLVGYFCLGMTLSRGAWIGFLAGMIFFGAAAHYRQKQTIFISLFIIIFFFLTFSGPLNNLRKLNLFSNNKNGFVRIINETFFSNDAVKKPLSQNISKLFKELNGSDRILYWQQAIRITEQSPIIGSGVNTYSQVAEENPRGAGGYPHNCYLQMAAEIGLLGLGAFLWALFILFKWSLRNIRNMKDPFLHSITLGLLSGLFGFLVHSGLDTNFYSVQLGNLMWVVMAAIVIAQKIELEPPKG